MSVGPTVVVAPQTFAVTVSPVGVTVQVAPATVQVVSAGTQGPPGAQGPVGPPATLPNVGTPGAYGDATHFVGVTTDAQGRVTAVNTFAVPATGVATFNTRTGDVVLTAADVDAALPTDIVQTDVANTFTVGSQTIQTGGNANKALVLQRNGTGQTANLLEVQKAGSEGAGVLAAVDLAGKLGLGIAVPTSRLDVRAQTSEDGVRIHTPNASFYSMRLFNDTYSTTTPIFDYYPQNDGSMQLGTNPATRLNIYTAGVVRAAILGTGEIGLGATNAVAAGMTVSIFDTVAANPKLHISASTGQTADVLQVEGAAGSIGLAYDPNNRLRLRKSAAPTTVTYANEYMHLGGGGTEFGANSYRLIGFGWITSAQTNSPAYIGYQETNVNGNTCGDIVFGTRSVTTDTAPTERVRITNGGNVGVGTSAPFSVLDVFGGALTLSGNSSTSTHRQQADLTPAAVDNTDATRKYRLIVNVWDTVAREVMRGEADGAAARIGFLGATAQAQQSIGAAATDLASVITLANNIRTALINLGLCKT